MGLFVRLAVLAFAVVFVQGGPVELSFSITCQSCVVYLDGNVQASVQSTNNNYYYYWSWYYNCPPEISYPVPSNTKVIAVRASQQNYWGNYPGFIGSTESGSIVSDHYWKCTNSEVDGWTKASFKDDSWLGANEVGSYYYYCGTMTGINQNAKWIWTSPSPNYANTIYCRKNIK